MVHPHDDLATIECLKRFQNPQIKSFTYDLKIGASLGDIRNFVIDRSDGEYLCTWDDDDWYSIDRLRVQFDALQSSAKAVCVLRKVLLYDSVGNIAYLSWDRLWENTLFFERKAVLEKNCRYPGLNQAEDYFFLNDLIAHNLVYPLEQPTLYIYNATGSNTCEPESFKYHFTKSRALSPYQTLMIAKAVKLDLSPEDASKRMRSRTFKSSLPYVIYQDARE